MNALLASVLLNIFFIQPTGLESLLIQHEGRIKPLDTFARESLRTTHGKEKFKDRSATDVILSWLLIPEFWEKEDFILIESAQVKKSLQLNLKQKRFSPQTLRINKDFASQIVELQSLRQRKEPLGSYFKKLEKLETKLLTYEAIKSGWLLKVKPSQEGTTWLSISDLKGKSHQDFKALLLNYVNLVSFKQKNSSDSSGFDLFKHREKLKKSLQQFNQTIFGTQKYKEGKIKTELAYNKWKPFRVAWIFYFLFLFLFSLKRIGGYKINSAVVTSIAGLGFLSHTAGLICRSYIMSRPPVSNMFETVVWVSWAALLASATFGVKKISRSFVAGVIVCFLSLFLTDLVPQVLDGRLQPLEAVLRSNFWLSTHVLIITTSYSFFFLAFILGDMALISYLMKKGKVSSQFFKPYVRPIYRLLQWGVVMLMGGTLLGAVWADYSWGRFWGWDPKESWALISLLAYLSILHGKLVGWVKDFELVLLAILGFFLVVMAWYGVNFILGKGLHSYGFGTTNGAPYVAGIFLTHIALCGAGFLLSRRKF